MSKQRNNMSPLKCAGTIAVAWGLAAGASVVSMLATATPSEDSSPARISGPSQTQTAAPAVSPAGLDRSGHARVGKASFYANRYSGKTMADGTPMNLYSNNAASVTLPLGTTARVTNLHTGQSALVTIQDRGPYVHGRIIDLSPSTASKIGLERKQGVTTVKVVPLAIPQADGTIKIVANNMRLTSANDM